MDKTKLPPVSNVTLFATLRAEHERAHEHLSLGVPEAIERLSLAITKEWPAVDRLLILGYITHGHAYLLRTLDALKAAEA